MIFFLNEETIFLAEEHALSGFTQKCRKPNHQMKIHTKIKPLLDLPLLHLKSIVMST